MHLSSVAIPLLSFAATSICDSTDISDAPFPPESIVFCNQPNFQGKCTPPTIFDGEGCYLIPDRDNQGGPGSSFYVR